MNCELLSFTQLDVLVRAIRKCTASEDKSDSWYDASGLYSLGEADRKLILHCISKGHLSVLRHINYTFDLELTRACLQEQTTHKHTAHSTRSTRWALKKELKGELEPFIQLNDQLIDFARAGKYLKFTGYSAVDIPTIHALEAVRQNVKSGKYTNDQIKYGLPENFKTSQIFTLNGQSLRNYLNVRSAKDAHQEIQDLARAIFSQLPVQHQFMYEDCIHGREI